MSSTASSSTPRCAASTSEPTSRSWSWISSARRRAARRAPDRRPTARPAGTRQRRAGLVLRLLSRLGPGEGRLPAGARARAGRSRAPPPGGRGARVPPSRPPVRLGRSAPAGARGLRRRGHRQDDAGARAGRAQWLDPRLLGRHPQATRGPRPDRAWGRRALLARVHDADLPGAGQDRADELDAGGWRDCRRDLPSAQRAGSVPRRARRSSRPVSIVKCRASTEVLLARVRERDLDPERTSDADAAIIRPSSPSSSR